jgi:FeS assembly SUF system regulator
MLRMSRLTDYGIVLLAHLAGRPAGGVHNARELAEEAGLPAPVVSKLLKVLTREGFLHSQRGAKGGYALARSPEAIRVAEVIEALEGPFALTACGVGICDRESSCVVRDPWQRINHALRRTLQEIRLSELIEPHPLLPVNSLHPTAAGAASGRPLAK